MLLVCCRCWHAPHRQARTGIRVGLITPGSIADAAWNSGAYAGLQRIHDSLGVAISHVEARTPAEQDEALRTYAAQGYDLVFAHGFEFQGAGGAGVGRVPEDRVHRDLGRAGARQRRAL